MTVTEVINEKRVRRGIPVSELARRTGMKYESLRVALKGGRKFTASEFLELCNELELELSDFPEN